MDYFDCAYFDEAYFDTDCAPSGSGKGRLRRFRPAPIPDQPRSDDEDVLMLIEVM